MKTAVLAAVAVAILGTAALADDKVSVQLDYVVRGNHAMFFVAKEKGYFAKQGIDVTAIQRGTGSPNAMRLVGNGNAEFGFGDLPTLAVARSQDVPVVALAAVNQHSPLAVLALVLVVIGPWIQSWARRQAEAAGRSAEHVTPMRKVLLVFDFSVSR